MNQNISKSIFAGIIATTAMTIIMVMAPNIGMPEMAPWKLLSGAMGVSIIVGWVLHFVMGILFALGYSFVFAPNVNIQNTWVKGVVFGIAAVVVAQIGMQVMGMVFEMPPMDGSMPMRLMAMLVGHVVFGLVTVKIIEK